VTNKCWYWKREMQCVERRRPTT